MSTFAEMFRDQRVAEVVEMPARPAVYEEPDGNPISNPRGFAEEQLRSLVHQVFSPGWPRPARQIVIAGVEDDQEIRFVAMEIAQALSSEVEASVCMADVNPQKDDADGHRPAHSSGFGFIRNYSDQVSTNLWRVPSYAFAGRERNVLSAAWLRNRLSELRLEFDFSILHSLPVNQSCEAALIAQLTDGLVIVLEANSTRRINAQKARDRLHAANARILGAVLNDRRFPIPDKLYKRI